MHMTASDLIPFAGFAIVPAVGADVVANMDHGPCPSGYYRVYTSVMVFHTDPLDRTIDIQISHLKGQAYMREVSTQSRGGGTDGKSLFSERPLLVLEGETLRGVVNPLAAGTSASLAVVYYELPSGHPIPFFP